MLGALPPRGMERGGDERHPGNRLCLGFRAKPMLTFYFAPGSSSMAVHIALHNSAGRLTNSPPVELILDSQVSYCPTTCNN